MNSSLKPALEHVLSFEGGYVDHPRDPGGATNMGITLATYRAYVDPKGTARDLRRLSRDAAAQIYRMHYWEEVRGDELPVGLDLLVFDHAVNAGTGTAARMLQRLLAVADDGVIGPRTLDACRRLPALQLVLTYTDRRLAHYRGLNGWRSFGRGWNRRVIAAREAALTLVNDEV